MRTFLQLSTDRKLHEANREAMRIDCKHNEIIGIDFGIGGGVSTFSIDIWEDN